MRKNRMMIKYHKKEFPFEVKESNELGIKGFLKFDSELKEIFRKLEESEDENWYLDKDGERLEPKALLSVSPWSISGPNGEIKLLCRYYNNESGEIWLNTEEGYPGELFKWLRE